MSDIKQVLEAMGYKVTNDGPYFFRAKPIYRESGNNTSLRISKKNGSFIDFSASLRGSLKDLTQISLNLKNPNDAGQWLEQYNLNLLVSNEKQAPVIEKDCKIFDKSILDDLLGDHSYWNARGVPSEILYQFRGGTSCGESMNNRYVFPIFDEVDRIIGLAGRDVTNKSLSKWKLLGSKSQWIFPYKSTKDCQETRNAILVESIGDYLALETAGVKGCFVLFGVYLSDNILSKIIGCNPSRVLLALNNDSQNGNVGQRSAEKIKYRLCRFFNSEQIITATPKDANDFGEMNKEQIELWKQEYSL